MPLGTLPYKVVRQAGAANDSNSVFVVPVNIVDAGAVVKGSAKITLDGSTSVAEQMQQVLERQILADAPTKAAAFDAIAASTLVGA
jgi:hypothetical protein